MSKPSRPRDTRPRETRRRLLDRWLRRRQRVPFGPDSPRDPDEPRGFDEGGAGVREPRRPKPGPPSMAAEADEPQDQYLDLGSSRT